MYAKTKWINYADGFEDNPTAPKLKPNTSLIPKNLFESQKSEIRMFYLDEKDVENVENELKKCKNPEEKEQKALEILRNPSNFMKTFKNKQVYLRTFPHTQIEFNKTRYFLLPEALESIPCALKSQNLSDLENGTKDFEKYSKQMGPLGELEQLMTIETKEFEKILTDFNVDKRKITIITDPLHEATRRQIFETAKVSGILSPDSRTFLSKSRAIFLIFQQLIIGINWRKNENWISKLKILEMLTGILEQGEGTYHLESTIRHKIQNFQNFFNYSKNPEYLEHFLLQKSHHSARMPISEYQKIAEYFELPIFSKFSSNSEFLIIWMARFFINLGWIFAFFKEIEQEHEQLREDMLKTVLHLVPDPGQFRDCAQFLKVLLSQKPESLWTLKNIELKNGQSFEVPQEKWFEKYLRRPINPGISIEMKDLKGGKR